MAEAFHKECSRCGIEKPAEDFSPDKRATTGLQPACRECCRKASKERRDRNLDAARKQARDYYAKNTDLVLKNNAAYRARHSDAIKKRKRDAYHRDKHKPEYKARLKAATRARKEAKREYDKAYRAKNPRLQIERAKAWRKANPEKRAAIIHNYDARRRAQEAGGITTSELAKWRAEQRKVCYWCSAKCADAFHVDHYVPLSKGGTHTADNLVIACPSCNLRKNAKDPLDFAQEVGRLF